MLIYFLIVLFSCLLVVTAVLFLRFLVATVTYLWKLGQNNHGKTRTIVTMGLLRAVGSVGLLRAVGSMGLLRAVGSMGLLRVVGSMDFLRAV